MLNYRSAHVPGGTFFFTVVTHRRRKVFHVEANRTLLGEVMRECQRDWPFEINAIVLLPDHLHAIWTYREMSGRMPGGTGPLIPASAMSHCIFPRICANWSEYRHDHCRDPVQ